MNERPHGVGHGVGHGHGQGKGKEVQHQKQRGTANVSREDAENEADRDRNGEREREKEKQKDMTSEEVREARYAGLVNALRLRGRSPPSSSHPDATTNPHTGPNTNTNTVKGTSGRIRLKPILVPPALSGGPYNVDDGPSFGPDYHPENAEGVKEDVKGMLSGGLMEVEGSLSQRTVCVLGLEPGTKEDSVRSVFRAFGRIRALSMPASPSPPSSSPPSSSLPSHPTSSSSSSSQHTPRGTEEKYKTAYVTYHTSDSVTRALQKYATESVYVRGKEVHLHRHVRGTYLPGENTEGNVLRRLKDLVDAREEESHVNEETEVKVDEDGVAEGQREGERESRGRQDHIPIPFRILPFPRIALPRPSSISSSPSHPFVNEPGTLSRILQRPSTPSTPSTPFSSSPPPPPLILPPRSQQHTTSATHSQSKIWDLPPVQAELLVAQAVSPFMRSSAEVGPTRHLKIYGAPRRWGVGDMGVWLSEFGTLMRITDGAYPPLSSSLSTFHRFTCPCGVPNHT